MTTNTGSYDISTLLAARFQSVAEFGMNTVADILQADLAAHNAIVTEMVSEMADPTSDRQRIYGSSVVGEMIEVDEYGRAPAQKAKGGTTVGFPLRKFQYAIGWTRDFLLQATPADLAIRQQAAQKAHLRNIQIQLKRAILMSANYTFMDFLVDNVSLGVRRLVNADGASIPDGPNGETFTGSSHTHYLAKAGASLAAADILGLISTVVEHGFGGSVRVAINTADEATVRALTGFVPYQDPRLVFGASTTGIANQRLDISRLDNRAIGILGAAEIWVKPWMPANYMFAWDAASPMKPLVYRHATAGALQGLRLAAEFDTFPLQAQMMEASYGFGVWNRTNGAVLYTGNTSWADPTL